MNRISILRRLASAAVPPGTPMTCAPPARVRARPGTTLIIPSLKRSGTHLLIDSVLNRFPRYRRRPLFIDLDEYARRSRPLDILRNCGASIIKTHYPQQSLPPEAEALLKDLAGSAHILQPRRDRARMWRSLQRFEPHATPTQFEHDLKAFHAWWGTYDIHPVAFDDMTDPDRFPDVIRRIAAVLDLPEPATLVPPPRPEDLPRVLTIKLMTRVLGPRAPVINTTIQFASGARPSQSPTRRGSRREDAFENIPTRISTPG